MYHVVKQDNMKHISFSIMQIYHINH